MEGYDIDIERSDVGWNIDVCVLNGSHEDNNDNTSLTKDGEVTTADATQNPSWTWKKTIERAVKRRKKISEWGKGGRVKGNVIDRNCVNNRVDSEDDYSINRAASPSATYIGNNTHQGSGEDETALGKSLGWLDKLNGTIARFEKPLKMISNPNRANIMQKNMVDILLELKNSDPSLNLSFDLIKAMLMDSRRQCRFYFFLDPELRYGYYMKEMHKLHTEFQEQRREMQVQEYTLRVRIHELELEVNGTMKEQLLVNVTRKKQKKIKLGISSRILEEKSSLGSIASNVNISIIIYALKGPSGVDKSKEKK
uniref:Cytochrome P450 n=1 Tax=Tanacetum cinerariifolium TaxID=118510 RepID=A0A6L2KN88_TANCI|nr:cytochrome P450 [Tanacetum cinerariifolium]